MELTDNSDKKRTTQDLGPEGLRAETQKRERFPDWAANKKMGNYHPKKWRILEPNSKND
jgi:hypothetical protein